MSENHIATPIVAPAGTIPATSSTFHELGLAKPVLDTLDQLGFVTLRRQRRKCFGEDRGPIADLCL